MELKTSAKELKKIFISSFSKILNFKYEDGNPFLINIEKKLYYVFLKNISPAYYPNYPDITRVQLPFSPHFNKIYNSNIPFVILGYDSICETFTAWDPNLIKTRLNTKSNVSLYSRMSFQEKLRLNIYKVHEISNGDKVVVFSYKSLPHFFTSYISTYNTSIDLSLFNSMDKSRKKPTQKKASNNQLSQIDKTISMELKSFKLKKDLIGAVIFCSDKYSIQYPNITLAMWSELINNYFFDDVTFK